jgi:hypothetical protein
MYEQHFGSIPENLELDHLCRNPACVRPDHLEPVTHLENLRRGAGTKMTPEIRKMIFDYASDGLSHRKIASIVGMGRTTIGDVLSGKRWG